MIASPSVPLSLLHPLHLRVVSFRAVPCPARVTALTSDPLWIFDAAGYEQQSEPLEPRVGGSKLSIKCLSRS